MFNKRLFDKHAAVLQKVGLNLPSWAGCYNRFC